jgi:hypothetical protein
MGIFCSLVCLLEALPRLERLETDWKQRDVGLRQLKPGERPPVLTPPTDKGTAQEIPKQESGPQLTRGE